MSLFRAIGRAVGGLAKGVGRVVKPVLPVVSRVVGGPKGLALMLGGGLLAALAGRAIGRAMSNPTVRDVVLGSRPQVETIPASQLISPPSSEEQGLLGSLHALSQRMLNVPFRQDLYDRALVDYDWALNTLKALSAGQLPQPFTQEIQHFFREDLGQNLNELANRGIINTSVGSGAIMGAMERALQRRMQYLPTLAGIVSSVPELSMKGAGFGIFTPLEFAQKQAEVPLHLWRGLAGFRHGVPGQVIVREGSPGLLGALLGGAGHALGSWFGRGLGRIV